MDNTILKQKDWKNANIQVFWGEIAPSDHLVQFYENEKNFLDTLEGFAGCGLISGDSVVILATKKHLDELNKRLSKQGFDMNALTASDQFITVEANDALESFMLNGWPDEDLFQSFVAGLLTRAKKDQRKVRAFGELVAVLWAKGLSGATVQLEDLWCRLHHQDDFLLYCAYPRSGFTQNSNESMHMLCKTHSMVIDGNARPSTEIYYRSV